MFKNQTKLVGLIIALAFGFLITTHIVLAVGSDVQVSGLTGSQNVYFGSAQSGTVLNSLLLLQSPLGNSKFRVDMNGNIYIGSTQICTSSGCTSSGGATGGGWTHNGTNVYLTTNTDNVGIGTNDPKTNLQVIGSISQVQPGQNYKAPSGWSGIFAEHSSPLLGLVQTDVVDQNWMIQNAGWDLFFSTFNDAGSITAQRMVIKGSSGNVGIGTASPGDKLHISGGNLLLDYTGSIRMKNSIGDPKTILYAGSNPASDTLSIQNNLGASGGDIRLITQGSGESMRITSSGNVGIGTASPAVKLEIRDDTTGTAQLRISDTGQNPELQLQYGVGANDHWAIYNKQDVDSFNIWGGGANRLTILQNGNVGVGLTDSLVKLAFPTSEKAGFKDMSYEGTIEFYNGANGNMTLQTTFNTGDINLLPGANGNVGIGTANPSAKLEVAGQIKITGGSPGVNKVLTTVNGDGLATWENISVGNISWNQLSGGTVAAGGDLTGSYPSPTVAKIQGRTVANIAPTLGSVLAWNISLLRWEPMNVSSLFTESDPKVAITSIDYVPKWNGSALVASSIYNNGTYVGIGTASPTQKLDVVGNIKTSNYLLTNYIYGATGSANEIIKIGDGGDSIGIGTGTYDPAAELDIRSADNNAEIFLHNSLTTNSTPHNDGANISLFDNNLWINNRQAGEIKILNNGAERVTINNLGNVGIGIGNPDPYFKLDVNGNVKVGGGFINILGMNLPLEGGQINLKDYGNAGTDQNNGWVIDNYDNGLRISDGDPAGSYATKMHFTSDGNISVFSYNSISPATFSVNGNLKFRREIETFSNSSNSYVTGLTKTITTKNSLGNNCTITVNNGLITATSC